LGETDATDPTDATSASTSTEGEALEGARKLPVHLIDPNPRQNRQAFDVQTLQELADSILEQGVLQPILVRPSENGRYVIVAGERRWRASRIAELDTIPAIILERDDVDSAFATATENIQREQLDIEDEARTFAYLMDLSGLSQRKLAKRLGLNHVYVSRRLKLLKRPDLMQPYRTGQLTLFEVLARIDQVPEVPEMPDMLDTRGTDSAERTDPQENAGAPTQLLTLETTEFELIERDDLPGFIVSRGPGNFRDDSTDGQNVSRRNSMGSTPFRWRPALQFRNWLNRIQPQAVPPDERASFKIQIAEIKAKLQEWEAALDRDQDQVQDIDPASDTSIVTGQTDGEAMGVGDAATTLVVEMENKGVSE
jgi:ParB/RepB/Spo0J family partition protein